MLVPLGDRCQSLHSGNSEDNRSIKKVKKMQILKPKLLSEVAVIKSVDALSSFSLSRTAMKSRRY